MEDLAEVSPLSRRAMWPVSARLQSGLRVLRIPLPAEPSVFLAVDLLIPRRPWGAHQEQKWPRKSAQRDKPFRKLQQRAVCRRHPDLCDTNEGFHVPINA